MGKQPGSLPEERVSKRNGPLNFPRDDRQPRRGQARTEVGGGACHFVPSTHHLPVAHTVGRVSGERFEKLLIFPPLLPMRLLERGKKTNPCRGCRRLRGARIIPHFLPTITLIEGQASARPWGGGESLWAARGSAESIPQPSPSSCELPGSLLP